MCIIGFNCLRNSLISLNILFMAVGLASIYIVHEKLLPSYITDLYIINIQIYVVFLLVPISVTGFIGAIQHQQLTLFLYLASLLLAVFYQSGFFLAIKFNLFEDTVERDWNSLSLDSKLQFKRDFKCCQFDDYVNKTFDIRLQCYNSNCCVGPPAPNCLCLNCENELQEVVKSARKIIGIVGTLFSFAMVLGVWLTRRYRNQKDPKGHASAFL